MYGIRRVPDEAVEKTLQHLAESEFKEVDQGTELLKATGIVKEGDTIDYSLVL